MTRQPFRVWVLTSPPIPDVSTLPTVSGMHIPRPAVFHRQRRQAIRLSKQKNDCKNFWCKHQKTSGASAFFVGECIERLNNKHLHHLYRRYLCHHFYHCYRCYRCYQIAQLELLNRPFKRRMNFGVPIGTTKFT